jgi:hypothetical protein
VDLTQWRVVLNSSEGHEFVQDVPAPQFDEVRHAGVCSEVCFTAYSALFFFYSKLWCLTVEVFIRCHHSSKKKFMDRGLF